MSPNQLKNDLKKLHRSQAKLRTIKERRKLMAQREHERTCPFCRMKKAGGVLLDLSGVMQKLAEHAEEQGVQAAEAPAAPLH